MDENNIFRNFEKTLKENDSFIADVENKVFILEKRLVVMKSSFIWKIFFPFLKFERLMSEYVFLFSIGIKSIFKHGLVSTYKSYKKWKYGRAELCEVPVSLTEEVRVIPKAMGENELRQFRYENWCVKNFIDYEKEEFMKKSMKKWKIKPKFSILMPVFNTPEIYLRKAINSVLEQIYPYWELCIYDDGSFHKIIRVLVDEYAKKDKRIKIKRGEKNKGVVDASNEAFLMSTGSFIALLNHDDELTRDALWRNAELIQEDPNVDFIYSDHDKMDTGVKCSRPQFKPDWSPELITSYDYIGYFRVFSKNLLNKIGLFRKKYKDSHDYDLLLRIKETTSKIRHIPTVLYHQRIDSWAPFLGDRENLIQQNSSKCALEDYFKRLKICAKVQIPDFAKEHKLSLYNLKFSPKNHKISIIIPTKNRYDLIVPCIDSILENTDYPNYEIIVVDTGSTDGQVLDYYKKLGSKIKLLEIVEEKFSFAHVNNQAVKESTGEYVVFLNNDTKVFSSDWLVQMRGTFDLSLNIGGVGAKLLYGNNTIQHAGVILGLYGTADHAYRYLIEGSGNFGYMFFPNVIRNYSACTAACLMVKRSCFDEVGGFDEQLALAYNDVDLCLKLCKNGYRIVYNPSVVLYHYEMSTRTLGEYPGETDYLRKKWGKLIDIDPYYNINLTRRSNSFLIKEYDEEEKFTPTQS